MCPCVFIVNIELSYANKAVVMVVNVKWFCFSLFDLAYCSFYTLVAVGFAKGFILYAYLLDILIKSIIEENSMLYHTGALYAIKKVGPELDIGLGWNMK